MTTRTSRRLALFSASAVLTLAAFAAPAFADEVAAEAATNVEQVIVTATRTEKALDEAPVSASVITAQEIDDRLVTDIKDLIKYEPGISVRSSPARFNAALSGTGRDGNSGFNVRGLEGNRVLIQVDGIRVPDSFGFGAQAVGRGDYAELDMLKSVEIVRGPSSALYGSDGVAGSVSFFTKDPEDFLRNGRSWGAQGKAGYASADDSRYGSLLFAGQSGKWQGLVSYTRREGSEQETRGDVGGAGAARTEANPQDFTSNSVLAKVIFDPAEGHRLRLTYDHVDREMDADVLSSVVPASPPFAATLALKAHDETDRDRIALDYRFSGGDGLLTQARASVYYQDSTTSQFTSETRSSTNRTRLNTFDNKVWGAGLQLDSKFSTGSLDHYVVWGGDWSKTQQEGIRSGTVPTPPDVFPTRAFPNTDYTLVGLYAQDEITLAGGKVVLYPALRWDHYDLKAKKDALYTGPDPKNSSDSHLSPKLGVVWNVTDEWRLFANIATGFKAPAPSQVNNAFSNPAQGYVSIPNPDLKPETSETAEVGVRWKSGRLSVQGSVYAGRYDDFISQEIVGGQLGNPANPARYQFINVGKVDITGIEGRALFDLDGGWTLIASASSTRGDAEGRTGKAPLASIDPFKITAGAAWRDPGGRYGGELTIIHSAGKDEKRTGTTCTGGCFVPPDFTTLDLTAFWNVTDTVTLRGGVFNLTDQKYWWWNDVRGVSGTALNRDAYTQPGRNFGLSLSLKL